MGGDKSGVQTLVLQKARGVRRGLWRAFILVRVRNGEWAGGALATPFSPDCRRMV
jgi:hypothetical protein